MTSKCLPLLIVTLVLAAPLPASSQEMAGALDNKTWLPTLITATPQEGFELAVTLARKGVSTTQPDKAILMTLRPAYARDADSLTAASHVVAVHFQTISAANNYWRTD